MTIEQDLKTIRDALHEAEDDLAAFKDNKFANALAALDRIEARTLPDLPDGWYLLSLFQPFAQGQFRCQLGHIMPYLVADAEGDSPREAIENAIGKIRCFR